MRKVDSVTGEVLSEDDENNDVITKCLANFVGTTNYGIHFVKEEEAECATKDPKLEEYFKKLDIWFPGKDLCDFQNPMLEEYMSKTDNCLSDKEGGCI